MHKLTIVVTETGRSEKIADDTNLHYFTSKKPTACFHYFSTGRKACLTQPTASHLACTYSPLSCGLINYNRSDETIKPISSNSLFNSRHQMHDSYAYSFTGIRRDISTNKKRITHKYIIIECIC